MYVMLCYFVMLCYATLRHVTLCYVMLCYVMLCYAMLCYAMLCYVMLCKNMNTSYLVAQYKPLSFGSGSYGWSNDRNVTGDITTWNMRNKRSAYAKLICAFVFATRIVQCLYFLNPKFPVSSHLLCLYNWFVSNLVGNQNTGLSPN